MKRVPKISKRNGKKTNLVAKGIPVEFAHEEQHMLSLFN
jgi:hypothetical protein